MKVGIRCNIKYETENKLTYLKIHLLQVSICKRLLHVLHQDDALKLLKLYFYVQVGM